MDCISSNDKINHSKCSNSDTNKRIKPNNNKGKYNKNNNKGKYNNNKNKSKFYFRLVKSDRKSTYVNGVLSKTTIKNLYDHVETPTSTASIATEKYTTRYVYDEKNC